MTDPDREFVSEPIRPDAGTFDADAMARGEPGLPAGFTWRDRHYTITSVESCWKESEACDHASDERYYRKRYFRVRVDTGELMTLYALRHMKHSESPKKRWWLFTVER
ncbi:MAG: DUF6504 family protein [Phycisphaerae bacterium]|nr:DUF6504 family protein [Phycisphaerae bacterium]